MNRADEMVAARVEAMQRELAGAISSDEKLNQELRVEPADLKPVRQSEKRPGSRGFARFLVAICLGVAGTLAWQSYGDATKQIIATRAPELGWSPEAKQAIASSIEWLGWTKPPLGPESTAADTAAADTATAKAPTALELAQLQQIAQSVAAVRQAVEQLATGQEQIARETARLESAITEVILKNPAGSARPPAATAGKPMPAPRSSGVPTSPQSSRMH
jgi:hypothetical protein